MASSAVIPSKSGMAMSMMCLLRRLDLLGHGDAAAGQLALQVEGPGSHRTTVGHRPEDLELEAVRILGVEREAHPVVRGADQRARVDEAPPGTHQIGQLAHLPGRVVHAHRAIVGSGDAGLLEEAQVMVLGAPRDAQERRIGISRLHLEAEDVAVEPHAALDVGHPEHQVLQPLEADAGGAHRPGYSTLTVMAAHAMMVSKPGTRSPPATGRTVTSPWGSSFFTRSTSTLPGSGTPTVTSTSMRPPLARTSVKSGRLDCRIASDTARQAAFVPSSPCTSTPIPNSSTIACAATLFSSRLSDDAAAHDPDRVAGDVRRGIGSEE